ncbi:MAG: hypothetical protein ACLQGP_39500 [Isosphaeraceae bacterium]
MGNIDNPRPRKARIGDVQPVEQPAEIPLMPAPTTLDGHTNELVVGPDESPELVERKALALASLAATVDQQHKDRAEQEAELAELARPRPAPTLPVPEELVTIEVIAPRIGLPDGEIVERGWIGEVPTSFAAGLIAKGKVKQAPGSKWLITTGPGHLVGSEWLSRGVPMQVTTKVANSYGSLPVSARPAPTDKQAAQTRAFWTEQQAREWYAREAPHLTRMDQLIAALSAPRPAPDPEDLERAARREKGENEFPNAPHRPAEIGWREAAALTAANKSRYRALKPCHVSLDTMTMLVLEPGDEFEAVPESMSGHMRANQDPNRLISHLASGKVEWIGDGTPGRIVEPTGPVPLPGRVVPQPSMIPRSVYSV